MKYYSYDIRIPMALLALGQLVVLILLIPIAVAAFWFLRFKLASIITAGEVALFLWLGGFISKFQRTALTFATNPGAEPVLYATVEDVATAGKFKFMPEDAGGLFRQGGDMVLGTIKGEMRCPVDRFRVEKVLSGSLGNHLVVHLGSESAALFPKWMGADEDAPKSQVERVEWGYKQIETMTRA